MPTAPKELEIFGGLQRNLAQAAMQAVASTVKTPWKVFNFEINATPDGMAYDVRFLVVPVSGAPIKVSANKPILDLVREIWKMRDAFDSSRWRGMKLSVTSAGGCNIEFKYDSASKQDPTPRQDLAAGNVDLDHPKAPQQEKPKLSMESAVLSEPRLQQAMGVLVQALVQAAPGHYAMLHLLVEARTVDGKISVLFTHGSPVVLNEYTTLVPDSLANAAFAVLEPLLGQDHSFPGFEIVLRKTAANKWDAQFHRLDERGPNWTSLPRYPIRVCGYGLSLAPVPDTVFRWMQSKSSLGIVAGARLSGPQASPKQVQVAVSEAGNKLTLGQGVTKAEEIVQVSEGPDIRKWMIETPIFHAVWPNGLDLRYPLASKTRFDLVATDDSLIFVQGPSDYEPRLLDTMAVEGQREVGRGKTSAGHEWIELGYEVQGTKWRQRHYSRKISPQRSFVVTAQCPESSVTPIFRAADEVTDSLSAPET